MMHLVLVVLLIGSAPAVPAASRWLLRSWQTDSGLPDNNVTGVVQDGEGFVWVATQGGLRRFDGMEFDSLSPERLPGVPNRVVRSLFLDRHKVMWLVTDRGPLVRIEGGKARVFPSDQYYVGSRVDGLAEDSEGAIWIAYGAGVVRVHGDTVQRVDLAGELPGNGPCLVTSGPDGVLWVARGGRIATWDSGSLRTAVNLETPIDAIQASPHGGLWIGARSGVFRKARGEDPVMVAQLPPRTTVRTMLEDDSGGLWIGTTTEGLFLFKDATLEKIATTHPEIFALARDREGNIWVGTGGGGVNHVRPRRMEVYGTESGLPFPSIRCVTEDAEGNIWVTTESGLLGRGRNDVWEMMDTEKGWQGGDATCVAGASWGVWVGTTSGLWQFTNGVFRAWQGVGTRFRYVRSLLPASNGDLWLTTDTPMGVARIRGGTVSVYALPDPQRNLRALVETADGTIWTACSDGRVFRSSAGGFVEETAIGQPRRLSIRSLAPDTDGGLWVGYAGLGLGRVLGRQVSRTSLPEGLGDDHVSQILSDGEGNLWYTGNYGLFQLPRDEVVSIYQDPARRVRSVRFGHGNGLPNVQPIYNHSPNVCRSRDGRLWFATRNGLLSVRSPARRENDKPPAVVLQSVLVDENPVARRDSQSPLRESRPAPLVDLRTPPVRLEIPPGHRKVEFRFAALSFFSPETVHFRYRLHGFDDDWVEAGPQRSALFSRLAPGEYKFEVTACSNTGVWNDQSFSLGLSVLPFFWQTVWFRITALLLFTGSIVGAVRYWSFRRLRREVEDLERQASLQRERTRIARDMHDEVGSKLSRLSLLSDMTVRHPGLDPDLKAEVTDISETARDTIRSLEEIVWSINPRNDTLNNLIHFLCRYAEDFFGGSNTECRFDVPAQVPEAALPPESRHNLLLAAKEALNNVLKHSGAKQVNLRFRMESGACTIEVADDGRGFQPGGAVEGRAGSGLANMRERMAAIGGECTVKSAPGAGTTVRFLLPWTGSTAPGVSTLYRTAQPLPGSAQSDRARDRNSL
jgi:signal transduction histidine kinase/ligand-binding sensor domain-containing protein